MFVYVDVSLLPCSGRIQVPMVTRSTLEVVIPEYAVTRLMGKSKNKLAQISEVIFYVPTITLFLYIPVSVSFS